MPIVLPFVVVPAVVFVGLALVLAFFATRALYELVVPPLAERIPIVGNYFVAAADALIADIEYRAEALVNAGATPLAEAIAAVPVHVTQLGDQAIATLWAIVYYIERVATGAASTAAGNAVGGLSATLAAITASVSLMTNQLVPQLQASILSVADQARLRLDDLTGRVGALETAIEGGITDALDRALVTVYGAIAAAEQRAINAAQSIEAGVRDYVTDQIRQWQNRLEAEIVAMRERIGALTGELERVLPGISERVGDLELAIPTTATGVKTLEDAFKKYLEECGDPLCDQYKPDIPNLQAVTQILETGLLAAWLTDAIVDPRGAARRTDAMVSGPIGNAVGAIVSVAR